MSLDGASSVWKAVFFIISNQWTGWSQSPQATGPGPIKTSQQCPRSVFVSAAIVAEVELGKTQDQPLKESDEPPHELANRICLSAGEGKKENTADAVCSPRSDSNVEREQQTKFIHYTHFFKPATLFLPSAPICFLRLCGNALFRHLSRSPLWTRP